MLITFLVILVGNLWRCASPQWQPSTETRRNLIALLLWLAAHSTLSGPALTSRPSFQLEESRQYWKKLGWASLAKSATAFPFCSSSLEDIATYACWQGATLLLLIRPVVQAHWTPPGAHRELYGFPWQRLRNPHCWLNVILLFLFLIVSTVFFRLHMTFLYVFLYPMCRLNRLGVTCWLLSQCQLLPPYKLLALQ